MVLIVVCLWGVTAIAAQPGKTVGAVAGWNDLLYRTWYLAGAVCTAAWLGLGTAVLLNRTRFGYAYGLLVILGGLLLRVVIVFSSDRL
jgi:hypothetical protein